jgi:hypothetical protein
MRFAALSQSGETTMPEEFTEAERRLAKAIGTTPEEARKLFKKSQEKLKDSTDLDFTNQKIDPKKTPQP